MLHDKIGNIGDPYLLKNKRFLSEPLHKKLPNVKQVITDCARNKPSLLAQILLVCIEDLSQRRSIRNQLSMRNDIAFPQVTDKLVQGWKIKGVSPRLVFGKGFYKALVKPRNDTLASPEPPPKSGQQV
ncbi:MAG TPA: hypothetical protein VJQ54_04255 [Candidatus Sulfotelmatobacter sp.]|nr:hypothetical protein [Candidatus Sulfotelmatobacter sp.]